MRLHEYGRNPDQRKASVNHPDLLLVGVAVSQATPHACMGTPTTMRCRKLAFTHTRDGFSRFEQARQAHLGTNGRQRSLMAMAPSGLDWQALYARLKSWGYEVGLVPCQAVRHTRKTMQDGPSQTADKEAYSVFDLLRQGQCCLPVARDSALPVASRLRQRAMAWKKRVSQLRHHLQAALHLALPELHALLKDLPPPTAWRF